MRLDIKTATTFHLPRERAKEAVLNGFILVNGKKITKPSHLIFEEEISATEELEKLIKGSPSSLKPSEIPLDIIFEDDHLMVINKQAGVSTHPPSIHGQDTIANAVVGALSEVEEGVRPGIVHRLDRQTTGLLIIAKTPEAKTILSKMIEERQVERKYLALCYGTFKIPSFQIKTNIMRDLHDRQKMKVCKTGGKEAITNALLKQSFFMGNFSLVELKLETGRTHQIRVHLSHIGNSIIGDKEYGIKPPSFFDKFKPNEALYNALTGAKRQMLHAFSLKFTHPVTQQEISLEAPIPSDFEAVLKVLS